MTDFQWPLLIGGVVFFFFGLRQTQKGLRAVTGERLRLVLGRLTKNRLTALFFGCLVTMMLQSSGATSVMLISFVETQLMTLVQAMAVMLGAGIGTTATVFLLSIQKITEYALLVVALGFIFQLSGSKRKKHLGLVIFGFGLIFYGMHLISTTASPLKESEVAAQIFAFFAANPAVTIVFSTFVAAMLHSAGTIGIALALAFAGTINLEMAIPIVLGANIGTCFTALITGFSTGGEGRRLALAQVITRVVGVALIYPFIGEIAVFVSQAGAYLGRYSTILEPGLAGHIVTTHILFNIALAIVFLPMLRPYNWVLEKLLPKDKQRGKRYKPKFLDDSALETPALAFAQVRRELLRITKIIDKQIKKSLRMFDREFEAHEEIKKIESEDDKVDISEKAIRFYLAKLSSQNLTEDEARRQLSLLAIGQDLEEIGDTISKEIVSLAKKKHKKQLVFSTQGWDDLQEMKELVSHNFDLAVAVLTQPAEELIAQALRHDDHMNEVEQEFRQSHLNRLNQGLQESFDTSSLHLDILSSLRRINGKITHIVKNVAEL